MQRINQIKDVCVCWSGIKPGQFGKLIFLTWCRTPCGNPLSSTSRSSLLVSSTTFLTLRCRKNLTFGGALVLPVHLPGMIPFIGRLAHSPVKKRQDQPHPFDDAATFARNWNPPSDTNSSSRPKNSTWWPKDSTWRPNDGSSQPKLKRIGSRKTSAVRFGMGRTSQTTTMHSPLSHIPTKPSLPGSNNNQNNLTNIRPFREIRARSSQLPQLQLKFEATTTT